MKPANFITFIFLFLFIPVFLLGQDYINYVPNPNLEGGSPYASGQIGLPGMCIPWDHAGWNSVDYCNTSASLWEYDIPFNIWGYQPARSGQGYAHLFAFENGQIRREYLQTKLHCTLMAGVVYQVSFYVSLAKRSKYSVDKLCAELSNEELTQPNYNEGIYLGDAVDIMNEVLSPLSDTLNWMQVTNTYVANGDENYITIGCFHTSNNMNIDTLSGSQNYSSYYIEDVSVIPISKIFNIGNDTLVCRGYPVTIGIDSLEGCGEIEYSWSNGATGARQTVIENGQFILSADFGFGTITDTIEISHLDSPEIVLPIDTVMCSGSTIILDAGNVFETYQWSTGETEQFIQVSEEGNYSIEVEDAIGCILTHAVNVEQINNPLVNLGPDSSFCIDEKFIIRTTEEITEYDELQWNDMSDLDSLIVEDDGIYWLTVSNMCDSKTDSITLIKYNCNLSLIIPNAFRPASSTNNKFLAIGTNIGNFSMQIYNRWGALVFTSTNIHDGWNGYDQNNKECPQGVYSYIIRYDAEEAEYSIDDGGIRKGSVLLLR